MIVFFTNVFKGNANDKIGINSDQVTSIWESVTQDNIAVTNIFGNGTTWQVEESIEEVAKKLNKRKWL